MQSVNLRYEDTLSYVDVDISNTDTNDTNKKQNKGCYNKALLLEEFIRPRVLAFKQREIPILTNA